MVECKHIEKKYGSLRVLGPLDFKLEANEKVALYGKSGSGKSTFLHLLGLLDQPTSGVLTVQNLDVSTFSDSEQSVWRRKNIGFVHQFFDLLDDFTALENVMIPLWLDGKNTDLKEAEDLLKDLGLGERLDHYPSMLSGGEKQRVSIARSILKKPLYLLADEPTGSLDSKTSEEIWDLLFRLCSDFKISLLCATHSDEAAKRFDRVLRLRDGLWE